MSKARYISRLELSTAGKAMKPRRAEPSMSCLLGWSRDTEIPSAPFLPRAPIPTPTPMIETSENTWQTESSSSFTYYAKAGTITRQFKAPVDPATIVQEQVEQRRRFSLVAEEAASKASDGSSSSDPVTGEQKINGTSISSIIATTKKFTKPSKGTKGVKGSKLRKRPKKKRAPVVPGPKAPFHCYGMNNTNGIINRRQTHNVLPDDPREIYPNALHAAVRHPNAERAAMAIKKAEFLKSHQDSVSAAAEELLAALAKDAKEAANELKAMNTRSTVAKHQKELKESNETKEEPEPVRRNQISNPMTDPSLTMWDLMAWPGSTETQDTEDQIDSKVEEVVVVPSKTKKNKKSKRIARKNTDLLPTQPSQVLYVERSTKLSPNGRRTITSRSNLKKMTIEEVAAYQKFEPQQIEIVNPKSFSGLSPAWTRNIPCAGKKSPPREPMPL